LLAISLQFFAVRIAGAVAVRAFTTGDIAFGSWFVAYGIAVISGVAVGITLLALDVALLGLTVAFGIWDVSVANVSA